MRVAVKHHASRCRCASRQMLLLFFFLHPGHWPNRNVYPFWFGFRLLAPAAAAASAARWWSASRFLLLLRCFPHDSGTFYRLQPLQECHIFLCHFPLPFKPIDRGCRHMAGLLLHPIVRAATSALDPFQVCQEADVVSPHLNLLFGGVRSVLPLWAELRSPAGGRASGRRAAARRGIGIFFRAVHWVEFGEWGCCVQPFFHCKQLPLQFFCHF